jgi:hypothetical protein
MSTKYEEDDLPDSLHETDFDNRDDWNDYAKIKKRKNDFHQEQLKAKSAELKLVQARVTLANHTNNGE